MMVRYKTFGEYLMAHASGPAEELKLEGKPKAEKKEPKKEPKKKAKK